MNSLLKNLLTPIFQVISKPGLGNPHSPYEIELMIGGVKPVAIISPEGVTPSMQKLIHKGTIFHIDDYSENGRLVQVFAQANKVEEGKELYARYFNSEEGYELLEEEDWNRRIGELLGYSENDIAWSNGNKYQNPLIRKIMEKTNTLRCWVRKEYMLKYAPEKKLS